jgi:NAD-specific glutamate dehydrogenase
MLGVSQLQECLTDRALVALSDRPHPRTRELSGLTGEALADVIAALEVYEDEFPVDAVAPASTALLNQTHRVPERSGGFFGVRGDLLVARVVLRLLRRLAGETEVEAAVQAILPEVAQLSDRWDLIRLVGHREDAVHKLISEKATAELERSLRDEVRAATAGQLAHERELMRLALWTKQEAVSHGEKPFDLPESVAVDVALLKACVSEVRSQGFETRAVSTRKQLFWEALVELTGSEDGARGLLDRVRPAAADDEALSELIELAERYLDGWRPKNFPGDDD